jgi:hypothetical protein
MESFDLAAQQRVSQQTRRVIGFRFRWCYSRAGEHGEPTVRYSRGLAGLCVLDQVE